MATKITKTTRNRYVDEDVRRLYAGLTQAQKDIATLKAPSKTAVIPAPNIDPLPSIAPSATVNPVEASSVVGVSSSYSPGDHAHEGLHSVAATSQPELTGDVTLSAGAAITLTQTGNNIEISASGGGGGQPIAPYNNGTVTTTLAIDWDNSENQYALLNEPLPGSTVITMANGVLGTYYALQLTQNIIGGGVVTWPASCKFGSIGNTLATVLGQANMFLFMFFNGDYVCLANNEGYNP